MTEGKHPVLGIESERERAVERLMEGFANDQLDMKEFERRVDAVNRSATKAELDAFVDALLAIQREAEADPEKVKGAPYELPVRRLDDVKAARELDLAWRG